MPDNLGLQYNRPIFYGQMLLELEKKVAEFAKIKRLFDSTNKILLAVSGGADSVALMYVMCALKREGVFGGELFCAHINHQLRPAESDLDEDFVVRQAAELQLPVTTRRVDVDGLARAGKLSIETAARKLRIDCLIDIAGANNCAAIATGHQKNDNAETVLQRLTRGTGFRGLAGIWPERAFEKSSCVVRIASPRPRLAQACVTQYASRNTQYEEKVRFVRPLLCVTRSEILNYLGKRNLNWRVDHTNADCTYRRNYIRHRLVPILQQDAAGSIIEQLAQLAQSACRFYHTVCRRADKVWPELARRLEEIENRKTEIEIPLAVFLPEHPAVKIELVRRSLAALGSGERDLTHRHYERICQLAGQNVSAKKFELPGGFLVRREYGKLIFSRVGKPHVKRGAKYCVVTLEIPGSTRFGDCLIEANIFEVEKEKFEAFKAEKSDFVERFDLDKLKLPLVVRPRQNGDRFWPLGLSTEKKVGKFLTAARVPHEIRREVLIVTDREKIIWVWPIRISERVKVTNKTSKILQLRIVV